MIQHMNTIHRRQFLQTTVMAVGGAALGELVALGDEPSYPLTDKTEWLAPYGGFKMGAESYSLRNFDLDGCLSHMQKMGLHYVEFFFGHLTPTSNEEKLNALSFPLMTEVEAALCEYEADEAIKAVILTGAGDRAFSAGADIHEMAGLSSEELAVRGETRGRISWHIANYSKPLIGAINGLAYGGAALLSSSLDLRIGCEKTQFRFLAASYGRVNSTWSLPALVGIPKAKELLYTGRVVAAEEAERIGLLNRIVPSAKLREAAVEMAQMIAKNDSRMVQGIKRLLHEGMGLDWHGRYDLEDEARATYLSAGHPRDGFKDFLARKPVRA